MNARLAALAMLAFSTGLPVFGSARTQDEAPPPDRRKTKVLDLIFRVEDIGGRVQDIRVKETATEVRIQLAADVLFDFDKADILPKAAAALKQAAEIIRAKAKGQVRIEGHTDSKGSDSYNQRLSERRADAVKNWLVEKENLRGVNFTARGLGARNPVAPNTKPDGSDDPDGRQKNRRVEIVVGKQ
jgi:outer membrane protein OmpA-like peptidoglycan-associated protein